MPAWEFQALNNVAKEHGWHQFISMQNYYSALYREEEREMIPYCRDAGIGLIPWSPLARGLLTRPYKSEPTFRQKSDIFSPYLIGKTTEVDGEIIGRVEKLAKKKGVSMAIVAMVWCLEKGVNPIVGLGSTGRVDEAVDAAKKAKEGLLTKEDIGYLDEAYVPKPLTAI